MTADSTRHRLQLLLAELRRLRSEGISALAVSEESVAHLRRAVGSRQGKTQLSGRTTERPPPVSSSPPPAAPRASRPSGSPESAASPARPAFPPAPQVRLPEGDKPARWNFLRDQVLADQVCCGQVHPGCQVVFGVGSLDASLFFVGEAPGAEEEVKGEPFVGPAGELLTRMIRAMGLNRSDVYIGNIMNWRPQIPSRVGNRPPTAEEMAYCLPYLRAQIEVVRPRLVIALGATAAAGLLQPPPKARLGDLRGRWHDFAGTPVMVTYHPSYILRSNTNRSKRLVWEDLLKVMERAEMPISEKQRSYFLAAS